MNNLYGQMQQDIASTANNLMTQMLCTEKGIDYTQLMQTAQQAHLQSIMQAEQNRQIAQVVKRHYQGNSGSFISKIRDAFAPDPVNPFMPMTMGMPMQQPMMAQPAQQVQSPEQVSQLFNPQPVEVPLEDDTTSKRLDNLENKMNNMEAMLAQIAQAVQK
ncbi:hypothetical protein COJ01_18145 [Priestia megaterium]|uniref:hypothetical protein n=1 Tax=Priestia megaterium TaxID=1404 RepID=UPI000BF918A7|nr:hypothetical protein [Priestia megaterium]PFK99966.1 hypothetical protein COJ01_18145 [Priestia megaterium]